MVKEQIVLSTKLDYHEIEKYIEEQQVSSVMLVCGKSIDSLEIGNYMKELATRIKVIRFGDFAPNPKYESVERGVEIFRANNCGMIVAVGGGSALDVAKCIKLYATLSPDELYLTQPIVPNDIKLISVPTTAGTGSEATRFAVIYYQGEKQSVAHESCIPDVVVLDPSTLKTLPDYHRKSTMLDALCHAIEAYWSVNSTEESRRYSKEAIELVIKYKDSYLANEDEGNLNMLMAANIAGKAINITQTTAGHAMAYKITSLFGLAHGHAVGICVSKLWRYMLKNVDRCIDARGTSHLKAVLKELAEAMGVTDACDAVDVYDKLLADLELEIPMITNPQHYVVLKKSVNPDRLKNNPVGLDEAAIDLLYHEILQAR